MVHSSVRMLSGQNLSAGQHDSQMLSTFADLAISPLLRDNLSRMGLTTCTPVQHEALPPLLAGDDVLAKSQTGSGKTVAFLLPTLERLLASPKSSAGRKRIRALVISPTRELASQISEVAAQLTHGSKLRTGVVFGGTSMSKDIRLLDGGVDVLVATPGRLWDHLSSQALYLDKVQILVLDEADRLLDVGFRKELERIIQQLPTKRQSLCFSATMPKELSEVLKAALREHHVQVDCIGTAAARETVSSVTQSFAVCSMDELPTCAAATITRELELNKGLGKVVVFCPTANQAQFISELMESFGVPNNPLHSRKSQSYRTRVSNEFRDARTGVIVASDVAARGVDYPDVSLVLQLGLPSSREQYVHRTGRTGRAGKVGSTQLLLNSWEADAARQMLKGLPLQEANVPLTHDWHTRGARAAKAVDKQTRSKAYSAMMGYYKQFLKPLGMDKATLVATCNDFATGAMALPEVPELPAKTVGMMGLKGVQGLRVAKGPSGSTEAMQDPRRGHQVPRSNSRLFKGQVGQHRGMSKKASPSSATRVDGRSHGPGGLA
eukprot:CAMPEP_0119343178 /NCGR_PEP_ID=MMETSP1333-20130426/106284_1 /TAXON_ID=418940 /ORGANISM="Scyphosphaera apsteinii, Strain RCC1455" /LENGTH=550 /DNA_ID=CAMNT_0007355555 /DNA_START=75 /DNA_END=1724 /DNA_ORIENTATION=-